MGKIRHRDCAAWGPNRDRDGTHATPVTPMAVRCERTDRQVLILGPLRHQQFCSACSHDLALPAVRTVCGTVVSRMRAPSLGTDLGTEPCRPAIKHNQCNQLLDLSGGAGGIRTLDRALQPYNGLANRRLQPLGHSSGKADMPDAGASRKRQMPAVARLRRFLKLKPECRHH
jgi:hypothetical protein